jgi:hypothetical protein
MTNDQPHSPATVTVTADQVTILLAALEDAAEYERDRAATCAECADESCTTCQWRLQAADGYDHLAAQLIQAADPSAAPQPSSPLTVSRTHQVTP